MRMTISRFLAGLLLVCWAGAAHAVQYPPGPTGTDTDTLVYVKYVQDPGATPHPVLPDTVWGLGGIITGFDPISTGFAIYIQNNAQDGSGEPAPWAGLDVFTGGNNLISVFSPALALGDSIVCYGKLDEFQGEGEITSFNGAFGSNAIVVRRVSIGNPVPKFKIRTAAQLNELPTNVSAEQWEGMLVRIREKLRVVRTSLTGGLGTNNSFLVVSNSVCPPNAVGPCDSVFVDGSTLANPNLAPPPTGAFVDSVQGIFNQRTRGYRIQLRSGTDIFDSTPPSLQDAYSIAPDTVRVVFDRNLTAASAQNVLNYTLSSTAASPNAAVRQVNHNIVHLKVTNGLSPCDAEGVTVNNVVNEANGIAMTSAALASFRNGICPIASIEAPQPDSLLVSPCQDRSKYAGAGSATGPRITTRGVATLSFGSNYWMETAAGGTRSGIVVFAPSTPLTLGRQYVVAGQVQEFFTETELVGTVYIKDEGVVAAPTPIIQTVHVLEDTTCDASQSVLNGEDYEGVLVQVKNVKITENRLSGQSFFVAQPFPTWAPDTILIDNNVARTYTPQKGFQVDVTGVLDLSFGTFRIQPRGNADIVQASGSTGVGPLPAGFSFAITPNPAREATVTFSLPARERVHIAVYDIAGRRLAVLADGEFDAGERSVTWDGRDTGGSQLGAGVYFYRMRIGNQTYERRGILMN